MTSRILSPYHWGQMEGVERQDTSELLLRACTESSQANFKTNHLSFLCNKLVVSKLLQIIQQERRGTSHCQEVQALMELLHSLITAVKVCHCTWIRSKPKGQSNKRIFLHWLLLTKINRLHKNMRKGIFIVSDLRNRPCYSPCNPQQD